MLWVYLALLAYLINAVAFVIDKYLLSAPIPNSFTYAFGVSILSLFAVALIPFGVVLPGSLYLIVAFLSGLSFLLGLIFLYESIRLSDISVASTKVGAFSILSSYIFSVVILDDVFSLLSFIAFVFLAVGVFFLSRADIKVLKHALAGGALFGLSLVFLKLNFNMGDFINGIFWTRMGFVLSGLIVLLIPETRSKIIRSYRKISSGPKFIFVLNKLIATAGFLVLYYSIRLGNVASVNSLLGFQFIFILILALALKGKLPGINENTQRNVLMNKVIGIALIFVGFVILVL